MATKLPRFSEGRFGRLGYGDMNSAFDAINALEDAEDSAGSLRRPRTFEIARWLLRVDASEIVGSTNRVYGVEVRRSGDTFTVVTGGRTCVAAGTGNTAYAINRAYLAGDPPIGVGRVVMIREQYDLEAKRVRDVQLGASASPDVFAAKITVVTDATNATYSVNVPGLGITLAGQSPYNRWTIAGINWLPKPVGHPCQVLRFIESGVTTYFLQVLETPVSEVCGAAASELSAPPQPAFSAAERLFMAANYR